MGFAARTCAISATAISEDEKVVVIILNLPYKYIDLSTLLELMRKQKREFVDTTDEIAVIREEFMNQVLNKQQIGMEHYTYFDFKPFAEITTGTYNDAGFIKERECPEYDADLPYANDSGLEHLMFHQWAVEYLMEDKIENLTLDIDLAIKLLLKIYFLRRSPMDWMLGQQHPDAEELKKQIALNIKTNEYLEQKLKITNKK